MKVSKVGEQPEREIDFGTFGKCSEQYLNFLSDYADLTLTAPEDPAFEQSGFGNGTSLDFSLTEQIFEDYFLTIAREMVGATIRLMEEGQGGDINLTQALQGLQDRNTAGHLSGMLSRFYLGGQRLPKNQGLQLALEPSTFDDRFGIFQATGQQFGLPAKALALDGQFTVALSATSPQSWLTVPPAVYTWPAPLIQHLNNLFAGAGSAISFLSRELFTPSQLQSRAYPLSRRISWEGADRFIWEFPESLQRQLGKNAAALAGMKIQTIPEKSIAQQWGSLVEIGLRQTEHPFTYEVIGTDEAGIALLEKIILNDSWENSVADFHLLYRPASVGLPGKGLQSKAGTEFVSFLTQTNLSTETNPIQGRGLAALAANLEGVLDRKDFLHRLWAASIVRSGGHYLYYQELGEGGKGLPAHLFGQDGTAAIYLLITYETTAPATYMNCGISDRQIDPQNDLVFARDASFRDKLPELQPGILLLEATRNAPSGGKRNSFADLFQLLSWEVKTGPGFSNQIQIGGELESIASAPIGPRKSDAAGEWLYEQIVPAHRFAKDPSQFLHRYPATDTKHFPLDRPSESENPYAGVGKAIEIHLQNRDIYGNAIPDPAAAVSHTLGYSDELISIHQWNGVKCEFEFSDGLHMRVRLSLNTDIYNESDAIRKDLRFYKKVYYQLFQKDADGAAHVRVDMRSTFLGDDLHAAPGSAAVGEYLDQLRSFVAQTYHFLNRKLHNQTATPPSVELSRTFQVGNINPATVFELLTEIQLRRTRHIHPDFASEEAVQLARTPVKPFSVENFEVALRHFAAGFESTFAGLKLATGFDKKELDNFEQQKDLFVVRMDRLNWTRGNPVVLALPPLSTQLLERDVNVGTYSKASGLDENAVNPQSFTRIDMDDWARLCLDAIDTFLSPTVSGAVYLLDQDLLKRVLQSKKDLAGAISGKLKPVLKGAQAVQVSEAVEKLRQRLLMELSQAYTVNAVVQYPIGFAQSGQGMRLYGSPVFKGSESPGQPYSLSNAKLSPENSSSLSFLFSTQTARKEPFVELDLDFKTTHLEYDIQENELFKGYQASSWLSFVLPPEGQPLGSAQIPIVLRDFPEAPVLLRQDARQSDDITSGMSALEMLEVATGWDYLVRYNQRLSAQDWLQVEVQFNLPESAQARGAAGMDLLDALAAFHFHWSALRTDLQNLLAPIDAKSIATLPESALQEASHALQAFERLVRNVAETWAAWTPPKPALVGAENAKTAKIFAVREFSPQNSSKLRVESKDLNEEAFSDIPDPVVLVGPEETPPTQLNPAGHDYAILYSEANAQPFRALSFEKLNVLAYQNALAAIYLSRNEELISGKKSNEDFVYYTPQTRFPYPVIPLLNNDIEVDIGSLLPGKNPLVNYLAEFFKKLLDKVHLPGQEKAITLQLDCSYAYRLANDPAQPLIRLPIVLVPPYEFRLDGPQADFLINATSLAGQLAREIVEWEEAEQPAPGNAQARLVFDVAVFSTISQSRQPVLRLRNVVLGLEGISF